jgi:large subunit ribosomal protein L22
VAVNNKGEAKAIAKHILMSPRKAREVINLIRGKNVKEAMAILKFTPRRASAPISKVIQSAAANAENNYEMNRDILYVAECFVDQGPSIKRIKIRAMGRADMMRRRTSHITVILKEKTAK